MAAGREGEGAREPPGGWSQAAPPEPAASRRVQTSGSWRAAARLGAVPPAPGASARAHAQARRRQVRALPLAAGGLLRCGAAPLEPTGARFGNKQQRAVFPSPSAPAVGRGVGVCARGEARREAGCGSSPTRRRWPRRVCRRESSGASRRPGVSVETGGERRPHSGGTLQPGRVGGWGCVPSPPSVLLSPVGAAGLLGKWAGGMVVVVGAQPGSAAAGTGSGADWCELRRGERRGTEDGSPCLAARSPVELCCLPEEASVEGNNGYDRTEYCG